MYFAMSNDLWLPKHARATISYHCHYYHLIFDAFQAAFREDPPIPRPQADGRNGLHDPLENAGESGTSCHHNVQPYATHNSDIRGQFFDLPLFFFQVQLREVLDLQLFLPARTVTATPAEAPRDRLKMFEVIIELDSDSSSWRGLFHIFFISCCSAVWLSQCDFSPTRWHTMAIMSQQQQKQWGNSTCM